MEPLFELPLSLPTRCSHQVLRALHQQLREAIGDGRLRPGLRLPSTRALASAQGISRNTAVAAYDLLLSEGYVSMRQGSGCYVADVLTRPAASRSATGPDWESRTQARSRSIPGGACPTARCEPCQSPIPVGILRACRPCAMQSQSTCLFPEPSPAARMMCWLPVAHNKPSTSWPECWRAPSQSRIPATHRCVQRLKPLARN